jgi:hypothetical protein
VCVAITIPASSSRLPPAPILPRFHASLSPSLCRSLLSSPLPPLHCYPARKPGPARRWYQTHAITKAGMRSNGARDEEHSINITYVLEQPVPVYRRTTTDRQHTRKAVMDTTDQFQSTARTPNAPASTLSNTSQAKLSSRVPPSPDRMQCRLQERATDVLYKIKKQADFQTTTGQRNTPSSANYASIRFSSSPPVSLVSLLDDLFSLALRSASAAVRW